MRFTVIISATRLEDGEEVRYRLPLEHEFRSQEQAEEWGAEKAQIRYPEAPVGEWTKHYVWAFNTNDPILNAKLAMKDMLLPEEPYIPKSIPQHRALIGYSHPLAPKPGDESEQTTVPTVEEQAAATRANLEEPEKSKDWKPERIGAIVYKWWREVRPNIANKLPAWNAPGMASYRAGMLLDLFMKSDAAKKDCKEVYPLDGDIKRHAKPAI